ncbi:MAG: protein translocase subunit SecD [Hyphomicrobiaceae bacterium]
MATLPNFLDDKTLKSFPNWLPHKKLSLGLDLKGGAHLLLQMDADELKTNTLVNMRGDVRKVLRDEKIKFTGLGVTSELVRVTLKDAADTDKAIKALNTLIEPIGNALLGTTGNTLTVSQEAPGVIAVQPTSEGLRDRISSASGAAIETVRRRVDSVGTTEPNIVRQGQERILVQVPGYDDTATLKRLIGETALLSFHEVHPQVTAEEARATRLPIGHKIYPDAEENGIDYVLRSEPIVRGEDLVDAQPGFDQRDNQPIITFRFNQSGARKFGRYTQQNVGRPFAIMLDDKVLSAPVIQEPILGGSGQISGNFDVKSANLLAVQLRSGALPTKLTIIEERTVGPSLGADSITGGRLAAIVGSIAVAAFIFFAYGMFGLYALAAVLVNMLLIVGVMSTIGSTLTLPGIAGLVLTVGMAVDANVLIYERIREELRNGKQPISAIDGGFKRALGTILDSNITTLIAAIVMFTLGAGPVRGFAVTLSLGIFATVFTAFTVTRLLVSLWIARQKTRQIPAPL